MFNPIRGAQTFNLLFFHLKNSEISRVFASIAVRDLAFSMVGIFEPIYLYIFFKENFSFQPLSLVCLYYAVFFLIFTLLCPFGALLSAKFGFKWVAIISTPLRCAYYALLAILPIYPFLLPVALVLFSIACALYWPGYHVFFAHVSNNKKRASSISIANIVAALSAAVGPAFGGLILLFFNYTVLFGATFALLIISALMFWFSPKIPEKYGATILTAIKSVFERKSKRVTVSFAAAGIEDQANGTIWPLFLFLLAINYSSLGFIISLSLVLTIVTNYVVGRISIKTGEEKILKFGIIQHMIAWAGRIFVFNPLSAAVLHGFFGVSRALVGVPFTSIMYSDVANSNGKSYESIILREQALNLGKVFFLGTTALFFVISNNFIPIFIFVAFITYFKGGIVNQKNAVSIQRNSVFPGTIMPEAGLASAIYKKEKSSTNPALASAHRDGSASVNPERNRQKRNFDI